MLSVATVGTQRSITIFERIKGHRFTIEGNHIHFSFGPVTETGRKELTDPRGTSIELTEGLNRF